MYEDEDKKTVTWKTVKNKLISEGREADIYKHIPLVVKDGDNILFYIHDLNWINESNIYGNVQENKEKLDKIRKHIFESKGYSTKIKSRKTGTFFKTFDNKDISLDIAMPDPNLTIAVATGDSTLNMTKQETFDEVLQNKKAFTHGGTYVIVELNKGYKMALPVFNNKRHEIKWKGSLNNWWWFRDWPGNRLCSS